MPEGHRLEKLVRDRIPEIIRQAGQEALIRRISDEQVRPFVALKLLEEAFKVNSMDASALG